MNGKAIAVTAVVAFVFGLGACGNVGGSTAAAKDGSSQSQTRPKKVEKPADLTGTWKQTNPNSQDSWMEATIANGTIEIDWVTQDSRSLYWKGTYEAPTKAGDWKWTSQGDTAAMEQSLLASQDTTKDFTYTKADGISWQASAMGVTTTVKTAKQ